MAARYTTHTTPPLILTWESEDGDHVISIVGDNVKELYRGPNMGVAKRVYDQTVKMYEERRVAEA